MPERPYHHGNLRADLIATAEQMLRQDGLEALSLRELARRAGVSHAAPQRHFRDRQALLSALATAGFERLNGELAAAAAAAGPAFEDLLRAVAGAFVRLATNETELFDLMMARTKAATEEIPEATEFFTVIGEMIDRGQREGRLRPGDPMRLQLLLGALLRGIALFAGSQRVTTEMVENLIDDAVTVLTLGDRPLG